MGNEFIPTLIQTIFWDAWLWESLREHMTDNIRKLAKDNDVEALYNIIRHELDEHHDSEEVMKRIDDFAQDITGAVGAVSTRDTIYQDVILAFLELSR